MSAVYYGIIRTITITPVDTACFWASDFTPLNLFPHLWNGESNCTYLVGFWELRRHVKNTWLCGTVKHGAKWWINASCGVWRHRVPPPRALWPWESHFSPLGLSSLICKLGMIIRLIVPPSWAVGRIKRTTACKVLSKCLDINSAQFVVLINIYLLNSPFLSSVPSSVKWGNDLWDPFQLSLLCDPVTSPFHLGVVFLESCPPVWLGPDPLKVTCSLCPQQV